jgi:hypothetical protein
LKRSDQTQKELISTSPTRLIQHQEEVSQYIVSLVAFMEFLQELQRTIKEEEPKKSDEDYILNRNFLSGEYHCGIYRTSYTQDNKTDLELILEHLTTLIRKTLQSPSSLMKGKRIFSDWENVQSFQHLSVYLGFYNFIPCFEDEKGLDKELARYCTDTFAGLYEPELHPVPDWEKLREAAMIRVRERLRFLYFYWKDRTDLLHSYLLQYREGIYIYYDKRNDRRGGWDLEHPHPLVYSDIDVGDGGEYAYEKWVELDEIEHHAALIVADEEQRLKGFIAALHGTLKLLASIATTRKLVTATQRPDVLTTLQSIFATLSQPEIKSESNQKQHIVEGTLATSTRETVTLQVRKEEHNGDMHTYHLTLTDSKHLSEPVPFLLQVSESGEAELFEDESDG